MRSLRNLGLLGVLTFLAAWPATSQMTMNMPNVRGVWNPTPGSGAAYQMDSSKGKMNMEITVVGKEAVNGKDGFWVEMSMNPNGQGQMYAKNLMSVDGKTISISRTIVQMGGQPPMELPAMMMNRNAGQQSSSADIRQDAQLVGTEDVTTPAGTFSCEHYKTKDGDAWISSKVTPWGLVKSVGNGQTIVIARLISDAKDQITGTPQKFDPAAMMRQRAGQQPPQQ
jgi:hypothetical protein